MSAISNSLSYADAGVDIAAGNELVDLIKPLAKSTRRKGAGASLGGFGGLFDLKACGFKDPVLVAANDGVGTKLKLAIDAHLHHGVGIDLVAMCVNDVLCCGAEPLFFLDYLATGQLEPEQLAQVVEGIAKGCELSGAALLGGETAEMPGFYQVGEYDLAGFCVGIVEKSKILDPEKIQVGDVAIALASSGVHSNGFSLVRKIISDGGFDWTDRPAGLGGASLGDVLLTPTQLYVKPILAALKTTLNIKGMAHITGGGLPENLPRCLGAGRSVQVDPTSWDILPIFQWLAEVGDVNAEAMFNTFNMGIGMVVIVPPDDTTATLDFFKAQGLPSYRIGEIIAGHGEVLGLY